MGLIWHRTLYNCDHFMNYEMELDKARIYLLTEQMLAYKLHCQLENVYLRINVGNKQPDTGNKIILDLRYFYVSLCCR